jgi:hypothetical protein
MVLEVQWVSNAATESSAKGRASMTSEELAEIATNDLLNDLRTSRTDLARIVEAVRQDRPPYVVVSIQAVKSWERREPEQWAKVVEWLVARKVSLVKV